MLFKIALALALMSASDAAPAEVVASLYVAPQLQFQLRAGKIIPHDVLTCAAVYEHSQFAEHNDSFIFLDCNGNVKLALDNVIFPKGKIIVKIESIGGRQ